MRTGILLASLAGLALLLLTDPPIARGGDDVELPWETVLEAERLRMVSDAIARLRTKPDRAQALRMMKKQGLLPIRIRETPSDGAIRWVFKVAVGPSVREAFRRGDRLGDIRGFAGDVVHVALLFDDEGRVRAKSWAVGDSAPVEMPQRPTWKTSMPPGVDDGSPNAEPREARSPYPLPTWVEQRSPVPGAPDDFVRVAKALDFLAWGDVVRGLELEAQPPARTRRARNQVVLSWLLSVRHPMVALEGLTQHAHPRVRTLALAALAQSDHPRSMWIASRLLEDEAPTYGRPAEWSIRVTPDPIRTVPLVPTTVRDIATSFLDHWMQKAGHPARHGAWKSYWDERKARSHCAGWVARRLTRACLGRSAIPASRHAQIRALLADVQQLPTPDRELTTLAVFRDGPLRGIIGEDVYLGAGARLGLQRLRALARGKVLTDDPDFQPDNKGRPSRYQEMVRRAVLQNADRWLRAEDAELVLALGRDFDSPLGAVKAAALAPARARALLDAAWTTRWQGPFGGSYKRFEIIKAMWSQLGDTPASLVVDWYFDEYVPQRSDATPLHDLPDFLLERGGKRDLRLLKTLILDERFDRVTNEMTIVYLARSLNEFLATKLGGMQHPLRSEVRAKAARWREIFRTTMRTHPRFKDL